MSLLLYLHHAYAIFLCGLVTSEILTGVISLTSPGLDTLISVLVGIVYIRLRQEDEKLNASVDKDNN